MPEFKWGRRSNEVRREIELDLILVCDQALEWSEFDLCLTEGKRGKKAQNEAVAAGLSELSWPDSKHNSGDRLSRAVHIEPYPLRYEDIARYQVLGGIMIAAGKLFNVKLRWLGPTSLRDYAHWELT